MIIYPSIDILDGKCVRLLKGEYDKVTVYSENPIDFAYKWQEAGADYIHIVDLNGARTGQSVNIETIKRIVNSVDVPIQTGGGIRSMERIEELFDAGVTRVILGTSAVKNPDFLKKALEKYKERIVVGIDAKDGYVAVDGWEVKSSFTAVEFAKKMQKLGVKTIVYTDISRDGMLKGPNLDAMKTMAQSVDMDVIASGGVGRINDVSDLKSTNVSGVIIGKALYENKVDLEKAIEIGGR